MPRPAAPSLSLITVAKEEIAKVLKSPELTLEQRAEWILLAIKAEAVGAKIQTAEHGSAFADEELETVL
jgi:hypothetical protein